MFGDLSKDTGVKALDAFLAENSYIEGYVPSQADAAVFDALKGKSPERSTYPHAERWFLHVKSFEAAARKQFAKSKKPADSYVSGGSAAEDEDDDVDLFGSDDEEEDAEVAKVREERLKAYAEKKSKKAVVIAKTSVLLDVKPWDDETDMEVVKTSVKSIEMEGLNWGAAKVRIWAGLRNLVLFDQTLMV
jgi:elongation factor 1-beta